MATWNFREVDQREEIAELKTQLAVKESKFAALEDQLFRKNAELCNIKESLDDLIPKLRLETSRNLELESKLTRREQDYHNEQLARSNLESALLRAEERFKSETTEVRRLQTILEDMGRDVDSKREFGQRQKEEKLAAERKMEEMRLEIRRLELSQQSSSKLPISSNHQSRQGARPRTSSLSNLRAVSLESELQEERASHKTAQAKLQAVQEDLIKAQDELIRVENENISLQRRQEKKDQEHKESLYAKEQELESLRAQGGSDALERERMLIERIEEEEQKNALLEEHLRHASSSSSTKEVSALKKQLVMLKEQVESETKRRLDLESKEAGLVQEREEALDRVQVLEARGRDLMEQLDNIRIAQLNQSIADPPAAPVASSDAMDTDDMANLSLDADSIARLLDAISRIRTERDSLRRDLEFVQIEAKCANDALREKISTFEEDIEALRARRIEASHVDIPMDDMCNTREQSIESLDAARLEVGRLSLMTEALSVTISRLASDNSKLNLNLSERDAELVIQLEEFGRVIKEKADLMEINSTNSERLEELQNELELNKEQLADITEKYRDLEQENEVRIKMSPLAIPLPSSPESDDSRDPESRPTTPVSPNTHAETVAALKTQINLLEARVLRRTEQIGLHQHDIKRLETNLKLAEDRLAEIGNELETVTMEREAMVEDCRVVREERDEAVRRYEKLQEEADAIANKLADSVKNTDASRRSKQEYEAALRTLQDEIEALNCKLRVAQETVNTSEKKREDYEVQLRSLEEEIQIANNKLADAEETMNSLDQERTSLRTSLNDNEALSTSLEQQLSTLQEDMDKTELAHSTEITSLVAIIFEKVSYAGHLVDLVRDGQLSLSRQMSLNAQLTDDIQSLKAIHNDVLHELEVQRSGGSAINEELGRRSEEIVALKKELEKAQAEHDASLRDLAVVKDELAVNISGIKQKEVEGTHLHEAYARLQEELGAGRKDITRLQEEIQSSSDEHNAAITQLTIDHEAAIDSLEGKLRNLKEELEKAQLKVLEAERSLVQANEESESFKSTNDGLQENMKRLEAAYAEEKADLESLIEELRKALQEEQDSRQLQTASSERDIQEALDKYEDSTKAAHELRLELSEIQKKLDAIQTKADTLEAERTSLQANNELLAAESHRRNLENRVIEKEMDSSRKQLAVAHNEIEQLRAKLAASESSGKAAELNLDLLKVHHDKTVQGLRRQLQELEHQAPSLKVTVNELKEKNNEMEDLLRSKTAEIEEYDDKFIALLKEKKKLSGKVEALTKKLQSLQKKLVGLNESTPPPTNVQSTSTMPRSVATENVPPVPTLPQSSAHKPIFVAPPPSISQIPRPATPEAKRTPFAAIQARTPESVNTPPMPMPGPLASPTIHSASAGKKRRAPDDFDPVEPLPPQPIIAEKPSTPRRKPLQALRSGFTPIRGNANANNRPLISHPSPLRRVTQSVQPIMSENINSPRRVVSVQQKPTGRTWLGKIRGGLTENSTKMPSGR